MSKIKQWRKERKLTQHEAGKLVGVSNVMWHRYETDSRKIPAELVLRFSSVTGIPPEELRPDVFGQVEATAAG